MKKLAPLVAAMALGVSLCACSSPENATSAAVSSSPPTTSTSLNWPGEAVTSGGITLTINQVAAVPTYPRMTNSVRKGSGYEQYENATPRTGGKFVRVDATVKNGTKKAIDLTCSLPVIAKLSDGEALYEPVDSLYEIEGNPECNDDLNPGFSSEMIWIFEVPRDVPAKMFTFADYDLGVNGSEIIAFREPV